MEKSFTIIYANRNRDLERIKASLLSLKNQVSQNFEVIFVDYGSSEDLIHGLGELVKTFDFVKFHALKTAPLLWNKSKALNYGIKKAVSPFIFIADVDLIFSSKATGHFGELCSPTGFSLFTLAYLNEAESKKITSLFDFEKIQVRNLGQVNGMILAPKQAFEAVNGFDEFFHFYGSEDMDLVARMENVGYSGKLDIEQYFYHIWHETYSGSEKNILTVNPRVHNIRRINQRHFLENQKNGITKPLRQHMWGEVVSEKDLAALKVPTVTYKIPNVSAFVEHFIYEILSSFKNEVIKVEFYEDPYFLSLKHKLKSILGKQTQPYIDLKKVNDMVLKQVVFNYRNFAYSYRVSEDLKSLTFIIKL